LGSYCSKLPQSRHKQSAGVIFPRFLNLYAAQFETVTAL
jgi:hypothetical protein